MRLKQTLCPQRVGQKAMAEQCGHTHKDRAGAGLWCAVRSIMYVNVCVCVCVWEGLRNEGME